jgi:hypothetical protein
MPVIMQRDHSQEKSPVHDFVDVFWRLDTDELTDRGQNLLLQPELFEDVDPKFGVRGLFLLYKGQWPAIRAKDVHFIVIGARKGRISTQKVYHEHGYLLSIGLQHAFQSEQEHAQYKQCT